MDKKLRSFLPTEIRSIDKENLIIEHKINTKDLDRYLTVVLPKGVNAKHFAKNPVVLWFHNMKGDGIPIAKNVGMTIEEEHIIAKTKFNANNEFAMKVFQSFADGFLNTWSIGFMPQKYTRYTEENMDEFNEKYNLKITKKQIKDAGFWGVYVIYKWELLEYSAVPVPGNPGATTDNVKFAETLVSRGLTNDEADINSFCIDINNCKRSFEETSEEKHAKEIEKQINTLNEEDRATEYDCECVDCGWETKSSKHCKDIKCEECGGEMRRKDRPGSGKKDGESTTTDNINKITTDTGNKTEEVKVNGVLSGKILKADKKRGVPSVIEEKLEEKEPEKKAAPEEKIKEKVEDRKEDTTKKVPEKKKEDASKEEELKEKKEDKPKEEKEEAKEPSDIEKLAALVTTLTAKVDALVKENTELKETVKKSVETDNLEDLRVLDEEQEEENKPQKKGFCSYLRAKKIIK